MELLAQCKEKINEADIVLVGFGKEFNIKENNIGEFSDGYHTFNELYDYRMLYNAALFNEWVKQGLYDVHKAKRHSDGEECFGGGWFIVQA